MKAGAAADFSCGEYTAAPAIPALAPQPIDKIRQNALMEAFNPGQEKPVPGLDPVKKKRWLSLCERVLALQPDYPNLMGSHCKEPGC